MLYVCSVIRRALLGWMYGTEANRNAERGGFGFAFVFLKALRKLFLSSLFI